ncbi:hypothetical protein BC834DRAFT_585843 [Gloeopeniophorella convolvens]|nr:hypothetical protein BC834DRAFT_585843 [Gloeopeniophorella convolvens]
MRPTFAAMETTRNRPEGPVPSSPSKITSLAASWPGRRQRSSLSACHPHRCALRTSKSYSRRRSRIGRSLQSSRQNCRFRHPCTSSYTPSPSLHSSRPSPHSFRRPGMLRPSLNRRKGGTIIMRRMFSTFYSNSSCRKGSFLETRRRYHPQSVDKTKLQRTVYRDSCFCLIIHVVQDQKM